MKIEKNIFVILLLTLMIGCSDWILMDKNLGTFDDQLIDQIHNSTNKIQIEYNDLPTDAISTIENSYSTDTFLSKLHASGLGYELTITDIDESNFKRIYFNLEGRKLERIRDKGKKDRRCFDLVYPVTFIMPDDSDIIVSNREDWEELKSWYDENPDSEVRPALQYPVDITLDDGTITNISSEEEMDEAKKNCIEFRCLELIYPVTFTMPDGSSNTVLSDDREGWQDIKGWYDENPDSEEKPTLQYPVDIVLEDRTVVSINSEEEMIAVKESCE